MRNKKARVGTALFRKVIHKVTTMSTVDDIAAGEVDTGIVTRTGQVNYISTITAHIIVKTRSKKPFGGNSFKNTVKH